MRNPPCAKSLFACVSFAAAFSKSNAFITPVAAPAGTRKAATLVRYNKNQAGACTSTSLYVRPPLSSSTISSSGNDNSVVTATSTPDVLLEESSIAASQARLVSDHHLTATVGPNGEVFVHDEPCPADPSAILLQHQPTTHDDSLVERILSSYLGPRVILAVLAAVYATNFPLGAIMADNLPASAVTCARMVLAALALSPFVAKLAPDLRLAAVVCGCFTSMGYVTQSLALVDTDPARVSFLGSVTVLWCPILEALIDKKPMGWKQAPQTWLAAILCLAGVGALELQGMDAAAALSSGISVGDGLALLQAVGFGTGVFWTSRMLTNRPDQALPVTATLVATTAFNAMLWCFADGWMTNTADWIHSAALPGLLFNADLRQVAAAIVWTGLISTSLNFYVELTVLGRMAPSEASVILASEPLWAALFAAAFMGASLSGADAVGGTLIVGACLVNALVGPSTFGWGDNVKTGAGVPALDSKKQE